MKHFIKSFFLLTVTFATAGVVFYYLVYVPLVGGYSVAVRTKEIKDTLLPGEILDIQGILTNTSKNASNFTIKLSMNTSKLLPKTFYLLAGESQKFSFRHGIDASLRPGNYPIELTVYRDAPFLGRDILLYNYKKEIHIGPAKDQEMLLTSKVIPQEPVKKPLEKKKKIVEEFVSARFSAEFPKKARYNSDYTAVIDIQNTSSTEETFEVFLKIINPVAYEKSVSHSVRLKPQERRLLNFVYSIRNENPEGNYQLKSWYKTRQAKSEEVVSGEFSLADEMPTLKIKKMGLDPVFGKPSEILVEATDDIGITDVSFLAATSKGNTRSDFKNIPMRLISGEARNGVWSCTYIPEKSNAYVFAFTAMDTKRQRIKLGDFPIKVIR